MDDRSFISASEVGDYLFCALAWRMRAEGYEATASQPAREAGTRWHREHGQGVTRARRLRRVALFFLIAALLLGLLLVLHLTMR